MVFDEAQHILGILEIAAVGGALSAGREAHLGNPLLSAALEAQHPVRPLYPFALQIFPALGFGASLPIAIAQSRASALASPPPRLQDGQEQQQEPVQEPVQEPCS